MDIIPKYRVDDIIYQKLLQNIRDGVWKNGELIPSESELCERYGVSRVSVRSAIQRLKGVGLITTRRGKGSYVRNVGSMYDYQNMQEEIELTIKDATEIEQLRQALEITCAQIIIERQVPEDLVEIEQAYRGMVEAAQKQDYAAYTKCDYAFHLSIILASHNERFAQIMQIFHQEFYNYLYQMNKFLVATPDVNYPVEKRFEASLYPHTAMYRSLVGAEFDNIGKNVAYIQVQNRERFMAYLKSREQAKQSQK